MSSPEDEKGVGDEPESDAPAPPAPADAPAPEADDVSESAETPAAGTPAVAGPPEEKAAPDGGLAQWGRVYTKYAGYAGFLAVLLGILVNLTRGQWSDVWAVMPLAIGGIAMLVGIGTNFEGFADAIISRKTFVGFNVVIVLACGIFLVVVFNYISYHYHFRADLTSAGRFGPDTRTIKWLKDLEREVHVHVVLPKGMDLEDHVSDVLDELQAVQPLIKIEYIDLNFDRQSALDLARKIGVERLEGGLILQYGEKFKHLKVQPDLIEVESINPYMRQPGQEPKVTYKVEDAVGTAIRGFVQGKDKTVYFTVNHGELLLDAGGRDEGVSLSLMKAELRRLGLEAKPLDLAKAKEIPDDCQAVVVAGALHKFLPREVSLLEAYVESDRGHLIYCAETAIFTRKGGRKEVTGLEELLKRWGVEVRPDAFTVMLVWRGPVLTKQDPLVAAPTADHQVSAPLRGRVAVMRDPCVLKASAVENSDYRTFELLKTESTYGETNPDMKKLSIDKEADIEGPIVLGYAVAKQDKPGAELDKGTKIVVLADVDICNNLGSQAPANFDIFLNAVNWMAGRESSIGARHRETQKRQVTVSPKAGAWVFTSVVAILPAAIFLVGIGVLIWRRR